MLVTMHWGIVQPGEKEAESEAKPTRALAPVTASKVALYSGLLRCHVQLAPELWLL